MDVCRKRTKLTAEKKISKSIHAVSLSRLGVYEETEVARLRTVRHGGVSSRGPSISLGK